MLLLLQDNNIINHFEKAKFRIITCVHCLGEGYDNHNIYAVVLLYYYYIQLYLALTNVLLMALGHAMALVLGPAAVDTWHLLMYY
jgi:hypothetical protein